MGNEVVIPIAGTSLQVLLGVDDPESAWSVFRHPPGSFHERGVAPHFVQAAMVANVFIDVGAYVGWYSCLANRANPRLQIVLFEPHVVSADRAKQNLALNAGLNAPTIVTSAIGDCDERVWLVTHGGRAMQNRTAPTKAFGEGSTAVPQTTLDIWCCTHSVRPDLIKVDVEGTETAALRGMREIIELFRPTLFIEVHPAEIAASGDDFDSEVDRLLNQGYTVEICDKDTGILTDVEDQGVPKCGNPVLVCRPKPGARSC